jgi:hypothetical protein
MDEFVLPSSLSGCADLLYTTRQMRLGIEKQIDELKARETSLKEHLIANLPNDGSTGVAGQVARVLIVKKEEPQVDDWEVYWKWIAKNKAWDCVQRRINPSAVKARWAEKKVVAGVSSYMNVTLSCTKVNG